MPPLPTPLPKLLLLMLLRPTLLLPPTKRLLPRAMRLPLPAMPLRPMPLLPLRLSRPRSRLLRRSKRLL
jgi:hypothetical protein